MKSGTDRAWEELRPPLEIEQALLAADRCLECGGAYAEAPCTLACPAGVDVAGFIGALAEGDVDEPRETIYDANILGGTCARVCPVEVLCEGSCVLKHEGRKPIEIGRLQRYATDEALARELPVRDRAPDTGKRVAVIGAGPAGLAAAGELAARGHDVTVYDERDEVGGLARFAIAPYRHQRSPCRRGARARAPGRGVPPRARRSTRPSGCASSRRSTRRSSSASGIGDDVDVRYDGDERQGVWSRCRFIERLKRRLPIDLGDRVVVDRRRQHGDRRRARGAAARRRRGDARLSAHRGRDARLSARGRGGARRGHRVPVPRQPDPARGQRPRRGDRVPGDAARRAGRDGRRRPEPVPGSEIMIPRRHRRQGDRPAAARGVPVLDRRARARPRATSVDRRGRPHGEPEYFARGTQRPAARPSSRPWAAPSARPRPSTSC